MTDLISRQAVIDVLNKHCILFEFHLPHEFYEVKKEIRELPAQPNLQPTCNQLATDCISRQAAIDALVDELAHRPDGYWDSGLKQYDVEVVLNQQPSIDAVEVVRCKDCKYWDVFDIHSTICPDSKRCKGIIGKMYTGSNFYCAYGERKDD